MSRSSSVIEVNGNRYDAVTGQVLGVAKRVAAQVRNPASGVIDGLVRKPALSIVSSIKSDKQQSPVRNRYNNPATRRQTQRSQTLMRGAVTKPAAALTPKSAESSKFHKPRTAIVRPARLLHAKTVSKNSRVEHFGKAMPRRLESIVRPVTRRATLSAAPQPLAAKAIPTAVPSLVSSVSHQQLERLLDHALTQADAHKLALKSRAKGWRRLMMAPKWLSLGASTLALALLAGFFAWQNIPQVSMKVADTRAHVSASVPAYAPMGYGVAGPVKADDDQVTVNYKAAGSASSSYAITQQASNWDSSSVAANNVPTGTQVQTSQVNGTTVYIYGQGNDATWVNHGVLFNLKDQANLSSDQILKIANGL